MEQAFGQSIDIYTIIVRLLQWWFLGSVFISLIILFFSKIILKIHTKRSKYLFAFVIFLVTALLAYYLEIFAARLIVDSDNYTKTLIISNFIILFLIKFFADFLVYKILLGVNKGKAIKSAVIGGILTNPFTALFLIYLIGSFMSMNY